MFAVLKRVKAEVKDDNVSLLAAGVAFYAMLAILPRACRPAPTSCSPTS
jgi:uncharacterized BrkB/YihY/UPF0761 family membrane protein